MTYNRCWADVAELYLVHQPILAYYRIVNGRDLSGYERPYLILISVLVSCILYVLIEKPFQKNIKFQGRVPLQMVFAVVIFSFIYSYEGMTENLPQFRLNSEVLKYLKFRYDNNPRLNNCRVDNKIINRGLLSYLNLRYFKTSLFNLN